MKIDIVVTKKGLPALWERGGGYRNTGHATIIACPDGGKKKPVYIRRKGELANREHALFVVRPGDLVIQAYQHRGDYEVNIMRIVRIDVENGEAELEGLHRFNQGEWDSAPPESFWWAINAVMSKANCYHCRRPHYTLEPTPALP